MRHILQICYRAALAAALLTGCNSGTDSIDHGPPDADTGGQLAIWVGGSAVSRTFSDGLAGQTPRDYTMGVGRVDLMRAADDPAPVTLIDNGDAWVAADMLGLTLVGTAHFSRIPAGTYTHARVLLTVGHFTVDATAHAGATTLPGALTITAALSDTKLDGQAMTKGQAQYRFVGGALTTSLGGALPGLPSTPGGTVVADGPRTWLVVALPLPMAVGANEAMDHKVTFLADVFGSFRWQDQTMAGFVDGVFDVQSTSGFEPVMSFGATGYHVTID